jgi:hypothetical protein
MFARTVSIRLKGNSVLELNQALESEIVPLLRQQKGFRDEVVLISPNGKEAQAISFWESKEDAETYNRQGFPEVQKRLSKVTEGTPQVQTYEVASSTLHNITARGSFA